MKQAIQNFHQITNSIQKNDKDLSLLANLQKSLFTLQPQQIDIQVYSRLMLSIYDLSNHNTLISYTQAKSYQTTSTTSFAVHNLAIRLKLIALRMISVLIQLLRTPANQMCRLEKQIQIEALQIMILSIRMCLDSDVQCTDQVIQYWDFCQQLYQYYCGLCFDEDRQQIRGKNKNNSVMSQDMHMLYLLNRFQIFHLSMNQVTFNISQIQNALIQSQKFRRFCKNINQSLLQTFDAYINNIITEITLKLLRYGSTDCLTQLSPYLPEQLKNTLKKLNEGGFNGDFGQNNVGQVYQLYWQVCKNGIQSVSMDSLQKFIAKDSVFEGEQIFQAIALLNQPIILQLWFNETNRRISKPINLSLAYQCFISLIITFLNSPKSYPQSKQNIYPPALTYINTTTHTDNLIQLCKQIILTLIRENKDTNVPVQIVAVHIAKFLVSLVSKLYKFQSWVELVQNLELVCTKHALLELSKTLAAIHLYYCLLSNHNSKQVYQKFTKFNGTDKNDSMKLLKACAEIQLSLTQNNENILNLIRKKPQFWILFCGTKQRTMLILNLQVEKFLQMDDIFDVYLALFEENCWDETNLQKVTGNLQNLLINCEFTKFNISRESVLRLKNCLGKYIQKQNPIFCLLFLYLACFHLHFQTIKHQHYGIVFNKYSKILKILDITKFDSEIISIVKILICKTCQKFKKQAVTFNGKCTPDAGEIIFIKILYQKIQSWTKDQFAQQTSMHKGGQQFIKYCLFEILCLNNRNEELQQIIDEQQNPQLQQLYANSQFISRKFKLILLRKLFRSNLIANQSVLTLNDIKELILLAESPQESLIYMSSAIKIFGEKGKKFISLLSEQNPKVGELCLQALNNQDY